MRVYWKCRSALVQDKPVSVAARRGLKPSAPKVTAGKLQYELLPPVEKEVVFFQRVQVPKYRGSRSQITTSIMAFGTVYLDSWIAGPSGLVQTKFACRNPRTAGTQWQVL